MSLILTFLGILINALVIYSQYLEIITSSKELCHFMIMMLPFFDLITVAANYSTTLVYLISWLKDNYDLLTS